MFRRKLVSKKPNIKNGNTKTFIGSLKMTKSNFGWWILAIFLFILFIGWINTLFDPTASYIDPLIWIVDLFMFPFGVSIAYFDYRTPIILRVLAKGAVLTVQVSIISVGVGFLIATILAIILVNKEKANKFSYHDLFNLFSKPGHRHPRFLSLFVIPIFVVFLLFLIKARDFLAQAYVDFFRSTPLLVQILLVYFGLPMMFPQYNPLMRELGWSSEVISGTIALTLNTAAYQAEIIRGGILAIPTGQTEAARALGLTSLQTMRYVILPQALRIIVPPLTNELVNVILNSSLISVVGARELTKRARELQSTYFLWQIFFIAGIFYFVITFSLSKVAKRIEEKLKIPGLGVAND